MRSQSGNNELPTESKWWQRLHFEKVVIMGLLILFYFWSCTPSRVWLELHGWNSKSGMELHTFAYYPVHIVAEYSPWWGEYMANQYFYYLKSWA